MKSREITKQKTVPPGDGLFFGEENAGRKIRQKTQAENSGRERSQENQAGKSVRKTSQENQAENAGWKTRQENQADKSGGKTSWENQLKGSAGSVSLALSFFSAGRRCSVPRTHRQRSPVWFYPSGPVPDVFQPIRKIARLFQCRRSGGSVFGL